MDVVFVGVGMENSVRLTITRTPEGQPVEGSTNTFIYLIGTNVTLNCSTANLPNSINSYIYRWRIVFNNCFLRGAATTQNITVVAVTLCDTGTFICTANDGTRTYSSEAFTLSVSCKC